MRTILQTSGFSPCRQLPVVVSALLCASLCIAQTITTAESKSNSDQAAESEHVRLSEILISTPQPYDSEQVARAKQKAAEIWESIRQGVDFADLARKYSQGPSAKFGGELGYFGHGSLAPSLDHLVFRMKVGEASDVIVTKQGFVILKVMDRKSAGARLDSMVEILAETTSPELKAYVEALKSRIYRSWYELIPRSAQSRHGSVSIEFAVRSDGAVSGQRILSSSGDSDLDRAALKAIGRAGPFSPLPKPVTPDPVKVLLRFEYNPNDSNSRMD